MPEKYDYIDYSIIPEHMVDSVKRYLEAGIKPGDFLTAVLENNLTESFARADSINQTHMLDWVKFLYNELPMSCWGSQEKVKNWIDKKRKERENKQKS